MDGKPLAAIFAIVLALAPALCIAQDDEEDSEGFAFIVGPRIGAAYAFMDSSEFSAQVSKIYPEGSYSPFNTVFGFNLEQRILLGRTRSHFAFQEVLTIHGLEQSIALPNLILLIGYRDESGIEFGAGPSLSLAGIGVVAGIGYTISYRGVYAPFDLSVTLPSPKSKFAIAITTGFNFVTNRTKPKPPPSE